MSSYRKRFISCSGTYYIDGTKSSPKWYWSFILLFLILLFCFIVAVVCLVAELSAGLSVIEEFQKHCKNDAVVTHDQLLRYERYFNSFPDKRLDQICGSVTCFIKNNKTVTGVNNRNPDARVLGETVFSDWCLKERERYQGNLSADPVRQLLDSDKNIYRHVQEYEKFVHLVGYNDSASLSDKLVSGLVQWRHYFETNDDEIFFGTSEYNKAMNGSKLYEYLRDTNVDAEGIHKSWLVKNRVFATELYVPDHVFFYNSSSNEIITDGVCVPHGNAVVKIYAIVLGFEGSHWIVQPVGQKWKQTSPGGIMKLADRCYKSNNFPRLFDRKLLNPDVSVGSLTNSDRRG